MGEPERKTLRRRSRNPFALTLHPFYPLLSVFLRSALENHFKMLASRMSRAASPTLSCPSGVSCLANLLQIPRSSPISKLSRFRQPNSSLFPRYATTQAAGGEEKVKGQVIGIDLGKRCRAECILISTKEHLGDADRCRLQAQQTRP